MCAAYSADFLFFDCRRGKKSRIIACTCNTFDFSQASRDFFFFFRVAHLQNGHRVFFYSSVVIFCWILGLFFRRFPSYTLEMWVYALETHTKFMFFTFTRARKKSAQFILSNRKRPNERKREVERLRFFLSSVSTTSNHTLDVYAQIPLLPSQKKIGTLHELSWSMLLCVRRF